MVLGWRRAFCTSTPKDQGRPGSPIKPDPTRRIQSRIGGFFSEPSTPRMQSQPVTPTLRCRTAPPPPTDTNPKLQCKTKKIAPRFFHRSAPSSPRSPSTFSILKSSLRLSKSRCGVCLRSGEGTAIFTAECGHIFHFPCMKKKQSLTCPICKFTWKEMSVTNSQQTQNTDSTTNKRVSHLRVYNDDEPLSSPTSGARFNPIPESDETEEDTDDFPGFFATAGNVVPVETKKVEVALLSESALVSVGKTNEIYAVVLRLKAQSAPATRAPIDLVAVLNVSRGVTADKLHLMRKVMRMVVSSLSAADRLSIVAFSSTSKRLLPLRRMNTAGRRSARRIINAVVSIDGAAVTSVADSLKKAAKVVEDRREKNSSSSIMLITDGHRGGPPVTSTRFSQLQIPVHTVNLSACVDAPPDVAVAKCITGLLGDVAQDLKIQLGFASGSAPAEISGVYSYAGGPALVGSGSSWCRVGDLYSEEERELLIELKVPSSLGGGAHRFLTVRCSHKDPSTQQTSCDKVERPLLIPRPRAVWTSTRDTQRLRCLFVTTRAVAESRKLAEREDVVGAHHMLATARALVLESGSEFVRRLEDELADLNWKMRNNSRGGGRAEAITPTSAWRAAERLAKVAIMRKSVNRVSDLHGFENARF